MATAGDRYNTLTGNIWSYAHRGDLTGIRAALARGVDVNIVNTVGWTACHAAAAGGQTRVLRLLSRAGADIDSIRDKGGNLPVHQAAQNGHLKALQLLQELGADVSRVRLSHAKGKAVRDFVSNAYKKKNTRKSTKEGNYAENKSDDDLDKRHINDTAVGYGRRQSKSTAYWGPRKTPISCKIKKKILKEKRQIRKKKARERSPIAEVIQSEADVNDNSQETEVKSNLGYLDTVQDVKRSIKQTRRNRQQRRSLPLTSVEPACSDNEIKEENNLSGLKTCDYNYLNKFSLSDSSDTDEEKGGEEPESYNDFGCFAALALDSDSDSDVNSDDSK